jgi:hypothetical protein
MREFLYHLRRNDMSDVLALVATGVLVWGIIQLTSCAATPLPV